jgi:hypothetical protein
MVQSLVAKLFLIEDARDLDGSVDMFIFLEQYFMPFVAGH